MLFIFSVRVLRTRAFSFFFRFCEKNNHILTAALNEHISLCGNCVHSALNFFETNFLLFSIQSIYGTNAARKSRFSTATIRRKWVGTWYSWIVSPWIILFTHKCAYAFACRMFFPSSVGVNAKQKTQKINEQKINLSFAESTYLTKYTFDDIANSHNFTHTILLCHQLTDKSLTKRIQRNEQVSHSYTTQTHTKKA